jgi:hypothetical protein
MTGSRVVLTGVAQMIRRLRPVAGLLVVGVVAACSVMGPAAVSGLRCDGVPASVCDQLLDESTRAAPPGAGAVIGLHVRCTAPACTEASGEASVTVTYANGQTVSSGIGWERPVGPAPGNPGAPPITDPTPLPVEPDCQGVPDPWCLEMAVGAGTTEPTEAPSSIVVRCTGVCTATRGDGETVLRFPDGREQTIGWGYESSGGAPILP